MAVHAGPVHLDANGLTGHAVVHLFRLLDAPGFKHAIANSAAELGLIASDEFYRNVIRHSSGIVDAAEYQPLTISSKETRCRAWIYMPARSLSKCPFTG